MWCQSDCQSQCLPHPPGPSDWSMEKATNLCWATRGLSLGLINIKAACKNSVFPTRLLSLGAVCRSCLWPNFPPAMQMEAPGREKEQEIRSQHAALANSISILFPPTQLCDWISRRVCMVAVGVLFVCCLS